MSSCNYVLLLDDSGSMNLQTTTFNMPNTRWIELIDNVKIIIEFVGNITKKTIDIHFLNNKSIYNVSSVEQFILYLQNNNIMPGGSTPLTQKLKELFDTEYYKKCRCQINAYIFTDGEPDGGYIHFYNLIKHRPNPSKYPISIIACTDDERNIAWMDKLDDDAPYVDVVDDAYNEMNQIKKIQSMNNDFIISIGTYILKILFG